MLTKRRQPAISLTLMVVVLFSSMGVAAQDAKPASQQTGNWSRINSVPTGDKLAVKLKNGQRVEGKLIAVSDSVLSLSVKGQPLDIKREEVFSVHHVTRKSAIKATLIGMAAGAGAGAAIGVAGSGGNNSFDKLDHAVTAGLTVLGAGAGAAVGYLVGRKSRKRVLIYQTN